MRDVRGIINDLKRIDFDNNNSVDYLEALIDELYDIPKAESAMECLFEMLENNPDVDFGSPGEIVHFLECFYKKGYEELLIESIKKKSYRTYFMDVK